MLLITIVAYTLLTGATALAPNAETFVVLQFLARAFAVAETILATVVIVEEFGPEHRGWGVGAAGAIQASGAGLASLLFGFVEILPYGWRALYVIGLVPLIFLTYWRRTLPETHRFLEQTEQVEKTVAARELLYGIAHLMRRYPKRLWALSATVFVTSIAVSAAGFFAPKYLQDVHGWSPTDVALMSFFGGVFAIMGNPLAGWMSDRRGRRPVTAAFALGLGVVTIALYNSSGIVLPGLWVALVFFSLGTSVTESTYSAEMFPTRQRSTAASLKSLMSTIGAISGLALISVLFGMFESNWTAISVLACLCFGVPVIVLTLLPETARARLEDIAPDTP